MQLKDVVPIIKAILEERDKIPLMINTERYIPNWRPDHHGEAMRGGIRKVLRIIEEAPVVDAVPVVRCKDCKESEECHLADENYLYCGVWDTIVHCNGYCDHGTKMDAKKG